MANSPEASLKEAVKDLTECEKTMFPFLTKYGQKIMVDEIYEKVIKARDLITDALNWDEPER